MNNLMSDQHTVAWLWFTLYAVTILLLIPNHPQDRTKAFSVEAYNEKALQFASKMILRVALVFPMLFLLKNAV